MLAKYLAILVAIFFSVSCADRVGAPLDNTKFILTKSLVIQSGFSSIYFQNDGTIRPNDVNNYKPFCSLNTELTSTAKFPIEIEADIFTITKIDNDSPSGKGVTSGAGQREGVTYETTLYLESELQPFIHTIICKRWVASEYKTYLSINEIQKIVGNVGNFEK